MKLTTDGLVIWENKTGEADRIITVLTPTGVISAYAKNSLRPKNRLTTSTAMLSYANFELFPGKNMYTVDDAQLKHRFTRLFADVPGYALSAYFCELLKLLAPINDDASDFMSLTLNMLHLLNDGKRDVRIIKSVFELRAASYAGYMPAIFECRCCGLSVPKRAYLDLIDGVFLCEKCSVKEQKPLNMPRAVLYAMRHILCKALNEAVSFCLGDDSMNTLCDLSEQYLTVQIDKEFATLNFYKSVRA